jgi:hypothetical protein
MASLESKTSKNYTNLGGGASNPDPKRRNLSGQEKIKKCSLTSQK